MRTAVYEDDMVLLYEDGTLIELRSVLGKSRAYIADLLDN